MDRSMVQRPITPDAALTLLRDKAARIEQILSDVGDAGSFHESQEALLRLIREARSMARQFGKLDEYMKTGKPGPREWAPR